MPQADAALHRAFRRAAGARVIAGNSAKLLFDGESTYTAMHALLDAATHRIHLENYIIRDDRCGVAFADHLIARAKAGIEVRVLYDWFGSIATGRSFWRKLREAGIAVRVFAPIRVFDPLLAFSRDHRKLLVVDGQHAITGGLCIGDEWVGDPAHGCQPWRDTAVAIDGPAGGEFDRAFWRTWSFHHPEARSEPPETAAAPVRAGEVDVRVVATEPGRERGFRSIDMLLGVSAQRIWVTDAYLSAPPRMYQAFKDAARDGVDVRLLLPGSSDLKVVRNLSRIGYRGLLRAGVRIWEWNGAMLHAKTMVADGHWVRIGSSNLNPASLLANWELDVFLHHDEIAHDMESKYLADLSRSSEVLLRNRRVPMGFGREIYPALSRQAPTEAQMVAHHRSMREQRTRALILLGSVVQGARAAIFGPLAFVLLALAVAFALFPTIMGWISAVLAALAGIAMLIRALGYRSNG